MIRWFAPLITGKYVLLNKMAFYDVLRNSRQALAEGSSGTGETSAWEAGVAGGGEGGSGGKAVGRRARSVPVFLFDLVGRCRLPVSKPESKALDAIM